MPAEFKKMTTALAVDWSDLESFSCPPVEKGGPSADPEASWGRRKSDVPGQKDELFFGYELPQRRWSKKKAGPPSPSSAAASSSPPVRSTRRRAFVPVLRTMATSGIPIGDVLADSGYAHRRAEHWAVPLRQMGARLVMDLHPTRPRTAGHPRRRDRLQRSAVLPVHTAGPVRARPARARCSRGRDHRTRQLTAELSSYKLGRIANDDEDGYHRVMCPAVMGKLRCPLRPASMTLSLERAEILDPPEHSPACCSQKSVTVGADVAAKTAQKHDYPSRAHRYSYARRTAVERTFSTAKDRASNDMTRGWCRLMGTGAISLFAGCVFVVRNERILDAFEKKREDDARRLADGLPPRTRRRRRRTLGDIASASANAPPRS